MKYGRLFLGIRPQAEILKDLEAIQQGFRAALTAKDLEGNCRWISPENFHLTLHFIGPATDEAVHELRQRLRDHAGLPSIIQPLEGAVGFPSSSKCRVAGIGAPAPSASLKTLWEKSGEALHQSAFALERRRFHPHLSLLRLNRPITLPAVSLPPVVVRADRYCLFQSRLGERGAKYEIIDEFPLAAHPVA